MTITNNKINKINKVNGVNGVNIEDELYNQLILLFGQKNRNYKYNGKIAEKNDDDIISDDLLNLMRRLYNEVINREPTIKIKSPRYVKRINSLKNEMQKSIRSYKKLQNNPRVSPNTFDKIYLTLKNILNQIRELEAEYEKYRELSDTPLFNAGYLYEEYCRENVIKKICQIDPYLEFEQGKYYRYYDNNQTEYNKRSGFKEGEVDFIIYKKLKVNNKLQQYLLRLYKKNKIKSTNYEYINFITHISECKLNKNDYLYALYQCDRAKQHLTGMSEGTSVYIVSNNVKLMVLTSQNHNKVPYDVIVNIYRLYNSYIEQGKTIDISDDDWIKEFIKKNIYEIMKNRLSIYNLESHMYSIFDNNYIVLYTNE